MAVTVMKSELAGPPQFFSPDFVCEQLFPGDEAEVLEFLARRPLHTAYMATLVRDNGLVHSNNRGVFYGYRNSAKNLVGVALIGHATIVEARTDAAVAAFAQLAAHSHQANLIRGERKTVESFWQHFSATGQTSRLVCRELLFEKKEITPLPEHLAHLRPATLDDIEYVLNVNAMLAFEEGGVNPFQRDREGFRARAARRIKQGRVWLGVKNDTPIFKADVVGDTPEAIYLEGIHVAPEERMKGHGKRCLTQLSSTLLRRTKSICLTVNQRKADTVKFYVKAGFDFHSEYETIYLR
jgi:predicted GNAT family acetyltransferase